MARKPEASNPRDEQLALTKGKTPRNAIMSIGILAAVVIGVLGFFYELKATNKAEQDARDKKTLALKSSTDVSGDKGQADINQMISAQRDAAASGAAARTASDVAVRSQPVRPMLTGTDFQNEVDKSGIDTPGAARHAAEDGIYTASISRHPARHEATVNRPRHCRQAFLRWKMHVLRAMRKMQMRMTALPTKSQSST
jgi:type IV secretion system protein VirB10